MSRGSRRNRQSNRNLKNEGLPRTGRKTHQSSKFVRLAPGIIAPLLFGLGIAPKIAFAVPGVTESFSGGWSSTTGTKTPSIPTPSGTVNTSFSGSYASWVWNYSLYSFTVTVSGIYTATATTSPVTNTTFFLTGLFSPSSTAPTTPITNFFASELSPSSSSPYTTTFSTLNLVAGTTYSVLIAYNIGGTQSADAFTFSMTGPGCAAFQSVNTCATSPISAGASSVASGLGLTTSPTFQGGSLQIDTSNQTYSQNFTLDASTTNTIDQAGHAATFSGVFSDATHGGNITIANSGSGGSVTFTGANTYTGATTIQSGATLALAGNGSIASSSQVTNNGVLDLSQTAGTSLTTLAGTGVVALGAQNLRMTAATGTFDGSITDGGIAGGTGGSLTIQQGALILNGTNTYSGGTVVNGGTLEVGDIDHASASVAGNVQVNASGTLRGHGTITGSVANNGGTVAPGGSIGTLSVGGNYSQASNATLAIEVSPTEASLLKVAGTATLNGVLAITYDPGTYTAKQYTIVSAANGVSGQFSSVTSTVSAGATLGSLQSALAYGANEVVLILTNVVAPINTSIYTALGTTSVMGAQTANTSLLDRMGRASAATAASPAGWIDATGGQTKIGGTNGLPGFQANRYGFLSGLDSKRGNYTVGVAAGYSHADIDEQQTGDSGSVDTLRVAAYGSRAFGGITLSTTAGYGLDFLSQKRPFGAAGTAEGDHIGHEFTLGGQASLPLSLGSFVVTPRAGLRYAYFHANGFGESGAGGQDLNVGTDNVHSLQPYAEVTLDKALGSDLKPINVQVRLGYAHELLDTNRSVAVNAQDGTLFTAPGTSLPRGYLTTGVSVSMRPTKAMSVSLGYDALINTTHASAQAANLKLGYQF
ncbi:autotransporter outer membrane beta-barrel domain-containing protein [Burkholderia sp. Ac-20365]|uniref:autotransporter outer membrane beta-barrel domain-containing protein n=1 Tax=Burkholderia sp. Ac-20365 TaxID=2703897 RepID=UPI00197BB806|nr:autotransporter outer membrane beta-barrel domain-containing protein [Burkholderia sp. Ac-20365]MBN3760842.1 autotransporter domain-containing protein [Burkholderia sp. Ac-20365]